MVAQTGSTNADVAAAARAGAVTGLVVVAEHQSAGRGRLDRSWVSPPRAGLTFSMLFRPPPPAGRWSLLPLLVATATAQALVEQTGVDVRLKWPNDLIVGDRKLAGVLAEVAGDAVVVGLGLNVSTRPAELPRPDATALALEAEEPVDRLPVLRAVLRRVGTAYEQWVAAGTAAAAVLPAYRTWCATLGRTVTATRPDGSTAHGVAIAVDDTGRLVLDTAAGSEVLSAGDVVHISAVSGP